MRPIWGLEQVVLPLVQAICKMPRPFGAAKAMAFEHKGQIVGGLVFSNWAPENGFIEVSAGSTNPRWMTREILNEATRYCFDVCGCHAMIARTEAGNPAVKIWRALGASESEIPHLRGRGKAEIVFVLTDEQWQNSKFRR